MSYRVEEIEKSIRNINTKICCIKKQLDEGATLEGENAIVYVGPEGVLQTSVDNLRYSETGLFIKGVDTQNILTINNHLDTSLLTLTNAGVLTLGVSNLNLSNNLSIQNDLLYFDTINNRIGVRKNNPTSKLHIKDDSNSSGTYTFIAENLSSTALMSFRSDGLLQVSTSAGTTNISGTQILTSTAGIGITTPTATLHAKGNSNSVGNVFVAQNLSNTANLTIANNGVSTFNFGTGGKVLITGAVGSSDILLELRRTTSSSGGFTFRSGNASSQEIHTTNGSMYLVTSASSSDIYFSTGTGRVFVNTSLANMTAFNTGFQFRVGQQAGSILNRWLNFGHNATYGQIIQSVQNGPTPAVDMLSLNPYGGNVGIGGVTATATLHVKGNSDSVGSSFRVENLSNTSFLDFVNTGILSSFSSNAVYSSTFYLAAFGSSNGYELRLDSTGTIQFGFTSRVYSAKIGLSSSGHRLRYYADISGGGLAGAPMHLFESNVAVGTTVGYVVQYMQLKPAGITGTGTAVNSFKWLDMVTSTAINLNNPNTTIFAIDYNPTITSYNGAHYGILIRPNTLNGFGLGATLPTALLDLEGSTTARASLRIRTGTAPTAPNDGDIWSNGTDLLVRFGGTTYTLVKV